MLVTLLEWLTKPGNKYFSGGEIRQTKINFRCTFWAVTLAGTTISGLFFGVHHWRPHSMNARKWISMVVANPTSTLTFVRPPETPTRVDLHVCKFQMCGLWIVGFQHTDGTWRWFAKEPLYTGRSTIGNGLRKDLLPQSWPVLTPDYWGLLGKATTTSAKGSGVGLASRTLCWFLTNAWPANHQCSSLSWLSFSFKI